MSATLAEHRLQLRVAQGLAEKIVCALRPACDRIEIVGSIRREARDVGDVDLLLIQREPKTIFSSGLLLDDLLAHLVEQGKLGPAEKDGPKFKKLPIARHPGVALNLFILQREDRDAWGMHMIVRTGPADFARRMVTTRAGEAIFSTLHPGLRPEHVEIRDGFKVYLDGSPVPCPEEADVFRAYGMAFIPPKERR